MTAQIIDATDYTIDLINSTPDGETYVVRMNSLWNADGDCTGYAITAASGPLNQEDIATLEADPENWDADNDLDLEQMSAEFVSGGRWQHVKELYAGHR